MIAPTFGCCPLSGKALVVTAFAPPAKMVQAATAAAKRSLLTHPPFTLLKQARSHDTFRHTFRRKILNWLITPPARLGLAGKRAHILTVRGRKTGRRYSTPVQLIIDGERRWLVAPYGEREWVKNARAAGEVELTRALKTTRHAVEEVGPEKAAPVLREYLRTTPVVKRFFGVTREDSLEAFAAEAARHPVFRLLD